jgi:hypothetical protein
MLLSGIALASLAALEFETPAVERSILTPRWGASVEVPIVGEEDASPFSSGEKKLPA